jgi:hypothetical protein
MNDRCLFLRIAKVLTCPAWLRTADEVRDQLSYRAANSELPIAKSIRAAENAVNKWCQYQKLAA